VPVRERLLVGIRYLRATPALGRIVAAEVTAMLVLGFYESLTFAVVAALGRPASFFGVLMSVQALGSIVGGLASAAVIHRIGEGRTLGLALAIWVIASVLYTIPSIPVACTALVVFGVAVPLNAVALATATQRFTPRRLTGRVAAAVGMFCNLAQMLSIAVGAALFDRVNYRELLVIVAAGAAAAALSLRKRSGRRYSRRTRSTPVSIGRVNSP
jgi:MFS family permease